MADLRTDFEDGELFLAEYINETNRAVNEGISTASQAAEDASGYLADLQEAIQDLPDGQAVSAQVAVNQTDITGLKSKTDFISKQSTESEEQALVFETNGGTQVGKIDANGADFANLKRGGQQVARMSDLPTKDTSIGDTPSTTHVPTTKAVKDYVDANSGDDYPIETETTASEEEEFVASNNQGTDTYAKVGSYGIKAKSYKKLNGDDAIPPLDITIGDNPSNSHTPSTQAVKDYVDNHSSGTSEPTQSTDDVIACETDEGEVVGFFDKDGLHVKKITDLNGEELTGKSGVLWVGDSISQLPNRIMGNWSMVNGRLYIPMIYGGQTAVNMGIHIGVVGLKLAASIVIPSSAGSTVPLTCKSGLMQEDGTLGILANFSAFEDNPPYYEHKGINPVYLRGVKGNLSAANDTLRTFCLYDENHTLGFSTVGTDGTYGNGQTNNINLSNYKYLRVAVNAASEADVLNSTIHVDINSVPVELKTHITIANKAFNNSGAEIAQVGFYASDYIDISSYIDQQHPTVPVYKDGLGTSQPSFTRISAGDEVNVESGAFVMSDIFETLRRKHIVIFYLNNITRKIEGADIAEKIYNQVKPIVDNAKDGKFVFAYTHWMAHSYTAEQIEAIDNLMTSKFGNKYVNMYKYMSQYGVADGIKYGLFTSSQVEGYTWEEVLSTGSGGDIGGTINVHENKYGAYLITRRLLEVCDDLGYFEKGDISVNSIFNDAQFLNGYTPWYMNN